MRKLRLLLFTCVLVVISAREAVSQIEYYYNVTFTIGGPTSVCTDGATSHTYTGPIEMTWSVNGGEFIGYNSGQSVAVRWNSLQSIGAGSLSATGSESDCWTDIEQSPPVTYCNITTYTSNPFSVYSSITDYSLYAGGWYCSGSSGTTITLNGSQTGVNYQLKANGSPIGSPVAGTGNAIPWANQTTTGSYTVVATKTSPSCTYTMPTSTTVTMRSPPTAYTVGGGGNYCTGGAGVSVTLSNSQTDATYQLKVNGSNSGSAVVGTGSGLTWAGSMAAGNYTVLATNGCEQTMTGSATVTIDPVTVGGVIASSATVCSPAAGALTLSGYSGAILRWEYSTAGAWYEIPNAAAVYNYTGLTTTTWFHAIVKSGTCPENASTAALITVDSPSTPGTLSSSADVYATSASGELSVTGGSTIQRWEQSTGSSWTTISNLDLTYNYSITQSTSYRVVVKNGVCPEANSNQADISLYPVPVISPASPPSINYGETVQLSVNGPYSGGYQWFKNGSQIQGETAQQYTASEPGLYFVQVKATPTAATGNSGTVIVKSVVEGFDSLLNTVSITAVLQEGVLESASLYSLPTDKVVQSITYGDGLGRGFQTIAVGQAPSGGDLVSHSAHSRYGTMDSTFLPYATETRDGRYRQYAIRGSAAHTSYTTSEQYLFYQNADKVAHDGHPYARTSITNDPTLRITEQGAPGQDWQPGLNHMVRSEMALNNTTTYRVRYWTAAGLTSVNYADNSVMVSITTDENGNKVQTYTDPRGLTVLKQVQMDETLEGVPTTWLETYYIYDAWGRIKFIVPPKAMKVFGTGASLNASTGSVAELIHKFTYDARGRVVEKKVPGAHVEYIVYDKLDRVVLVQDGKLRATNKWMFLKYDILNRVVYSGLYKNTAQTTRTAVQALLDAIVYSPAAPWYESEAVDGYTNNAFPTAGTEANKIISVAYYDHYNFDRTGADDFTYDSAHLTGQAATRSSATRGLATGGKRVVLDAAGNVPVTPYWITSAVFYDRYDRPIQTQTSNHLHTGWTAATLDKNTVVYDFVKVLKSKSTHYQDAATSVTLDDRSDYDPAGRVLKTYRKINGGTEQLLAKYEYNALGQVVDKKLHEVTAGGGTFLQSVDFRYNIRGWLKTINNAQLTVDGNNDESNDYFGMELVYQTAESGMSNTLYYNGNISALKWKGPGTSGAADQRSYKYSYDKSDRLKTATFQANTGVAWTKEAGTLNEEMTYDHNGNIKTLVRKQNQRGNSGIDVTSTPQDIDNLTYLYGSNFNKLTRVNEAATATGGFLNGINTTTEYFYDSLGSLTVDRNKGIDTLKYNFLGKPQRISFLSGKKIVYIYDAAGTKLTVKTYQGATLLTCTNYSGSFVYEGSTPALSFFGSPEGRVVKNGSNFEYQYAIADHQGNTRVVFSSATPSPEAVTATMEVATNSDFQNYTNRVNFDLFDHTDAGTTYTYAQKLTGATNSQVGVAKSYKVYAGDKVKIEAYAKYTLPSGTASNIAGFAAALFNAFGVAAPGGGEVGTPSAALNTWGGLVVGGSGGNSSGPKAFVNIVVFDKNYKLLDANWEAIDPGAYQDGATPVVAHDYMMREYTVKEEGYVYMFVSNENPTLVEVYFDDVVMTHTKGNVVQYNEYYPFGMQTANSWTRENNLGNSFLANSGTELNTTSSLYDLDYRNYDPALGRMNQVDPLATSFASITPYNYSFNDPVTFTDPSGAKPDDFSNPDFDQFGGCLTCWYNNGGDFGNSNLQVMDPMGGGVYSTWNPTTAGGYRDAGFMLYGNGGGHDFSEFRSWINVTIYDRHRPQRIADGINAAWNDESSNDITLDNNGQEVTREVPIYEIRFRTMQIESDASMKVIFYKAIVGYKTVHREIRSNGTHLRSNHVSVTFKKGADNEVHKNLSAYFSGIMQEASKQGITSVKVSSTTNHPSNKKKSAHSVENGARAFDISVINGQPVTINNPLSSKLQKIVEQTPGWRENYGPDIIQKMSKGSAILAPWARESKGGHYDHIHVSVPR